MYLDSGGWFPAFGNWHEKLNSSVWFMFWFCFSFLQFGDQVLLGPVKTRWNGENSNESRDSCQPSGVHTGSVLGLADSIWPLSSSTLGISFSQQGGSSSSSPQPESEVPLLQIPRICPMRLPKENLSTNNVAVTKSNTSLAMALINLSWTNQREAAGFPSFIHSTAVPVIPASTQ